MVNGYTEKFWLDSPCVLFTLNGLTFIPTPDMTLNEKLNALTRLVLVVTPMLYILGWDWWLVFLLGSLLAILVMKYIGTTACCGSGCRATEGFSYAKQEGCPSCGILSIPSGITPFPQRENFTLLEDDAYSNMANTIQDDPMTLFAHPASISHHSHSSSPACCVTPIPPILGVYWETPPSEFLQVSQVPQECCDGSEGTAEYNYSFNQYLIGNSYAGLQNDISFTANVPLSDAKLYMNAQFDSYDLQFRKDMIRNFEHRQSRYYRDGCGQPVTPLEYCCYE